jgi:hypothetical protein
LAESKKSVDIIFKKSLKLNNEAEEHNLDNNSNEKDAEI